MNRNACFWILLIIAFYLCIGNSWANSVNNEENQEIMLNPKTINLDENNNITILKTTFNTTNKITTTNKINTTNEDTITNKNTSSKSNTTSKNVDIKLKTNIQILSKITYNSQNIKVELEDTKGIKINNAKIYCIIQYNNNTKYYKKYTDKKGIAKFKFDINSNFIAKFEFKGTNNYSKTSSKKIKVIKEVPLKTITQLSTDFKEYIEKNGKIPRRIKINETYFSNEEIYYLMIKSILNIKKSMKTSIKLKSLNSAKNQNYKQINGIIYLNEYLQITKNILEFTNQYKIAPNYAISSLGNIPYSETFYMYSRILSYYDSKKTLANYVTLININSFKKTEINILNIMEHNLDYILLNNKYKIQNSVLNEKNKEKSLKKYLINSKNCDITNTKIKKLTKTLTSSLKDTYIKAKTIFEYVRDNIYYKNYNNTLHGAIKTLTKKLGNCVDQSHLLVALSRAAGIPARYVHSSSCKFTSGLVCGHVWTQLLIGDIWVVADPTSYRNSLGVVKNWNNYNYQLKGKYSSLPF